jgi:uncharacterized DUF497 family protein
MQQTRYENSELQYRFNTEIPYYIKMITPTIFEWDDEKAARNGEKHGVPFEAAVDVFMGPKRIERHDTRRDYGEDRVTVIGTVDDYVLHVTYTMRGQVGRIISARLASRKERKYYGHRS